MTKLLNIDTIAPKETREIILGGEHYQLNVTSVENFLEIAKFEKKLSENQELEGQIKLIVDLINQFIPKLSKEQLMSLDVRQLRLIVEFIKDEIPEEMLEGYEPPKEEGTEEEPTDKEDAQVK